MLIKGLLIAEGYRASVKRINTALRVLDPLGCAARRAGLIKCRTYNVAGPNALWHIDGNHKLIRWGFVIHGCIDGYSRFIIYLCCRTSNESMTVAQCFVDQIHKYGVPSRV